MVLVTGTESRDVVSPVPLPPMLVPWPHEVDRRSIPFESRGMQEKGVVGAREWEGDWSW